MYELAFYCETLSQANRLFRWFKTQDIQPETSIVVINVMPAFAYAEIGDGAASYAWGHTSLQERQQVPIRELVHDMNKLGFHAESKLLTGSRVAELSKFCNAHAIDRLCLLKSGNFWFDRFMIHQLIKKLSAQTQTKIIGVSA